MTCEYKIQFILYSITVIEVAVSKRDYYRPTAISRIYFIKILSKSTIYRFRIS